MNFLAYHEKKSRGTFDFPIEFYFINKAHPRYEMPIHWHMEYELIRVLAGELELSLNEETMHLTAGDAALVCGGVVHGGKPSACVYECIVFDFSHFLQSGPIKHMPAVRFMEQSVQLHAFYAAESAPAQLLSRLFDAMEREYPGYEWTVTGILFEYLGIIVRQKLYTVPSQTGEQPRRVLQIKKALERIRTDYATVLTLAELADEAGLSPKYFCRIFRQITGRTPMDYLNFYRVECAAECLLTSTQSVTEIALASGFNDLSYFARQFKRYKGCSARDYRHLK